MSGLTRLQRQNEDHFAERSCERKIRYETRAHALAVRRRMSERLKVYGPCEFCNGYHIGNPGFSNGYDDLDRKTGRRKEAKRARERYRIKGRDEVTE